MVPLANPQDLIRASWGTSLPSNISNDQLDEEIAKMLLKEAKDKLNTPWSSSLSLNRGESSERGPLQTNKRFLKSVIRDVNEHNRNVGQRVQEEIKVPDYQRRRGHEGGSRVLDLRPHKGKERGRREEEEEERMLEIAIARASVSRDGDSSKASDSERGSSLRRELGPKTGTSASAASCSTVAVGSSSKMDKYFSPAYDPRLDVSLDDITDPNTGLVREANYDDWERILGQVKEQKEEKRRAADERRREKQRKKEKKRRKEAEDRGGEEKKKKRKKRKRPDSSSESDHDKGLTNYKSTHAQRTARKELGLMDVEGYAKRGKVREWDLGKENPT